MLFMTSVWVLLMAAGSVKAQERIDDWYGQEFTELHAQLQYDKSAVGNKFKYVQHGNDKVSLTMTDYRGVKCQYISLDGGYTVSYRVDHYNGKAYPMRKEAIQRTWENRSGIYVLKNTVVAMFDDKHKSVGFALLADLKKNGHMPGGKLEGNPIFIK